MRNPAAKGRPDSNQAMIVKAYKDLHCSVVDLHDKGLGVPDILVGCAGVNSLVEIKSEDGELRASQWLFIRTWKGAKVTIIKTVDDVLAHVTSLRSWYRK